MRIFIVAIFFYSFSCLGQELVDTLKISSDNSLYDDEIPEDLILILGSEGGGISPEIISKSTKSISIPMQGSVESLNVGAAAGIFIYEYFRRYRSNVRV